MRYIALITLIALASCKPGTVALDLETCDVPQSTIISETSATTETFIDCTPTALTNEASLSFIFNSDGKSCMVATDADDEIIFSDCNGTWSRPSCINVEVDNGPTHSDFSLDAMNPTSTGFNANISFDGDVETSISYACTIIEVPK